MISAMPKSTRAIVAVAAEMPEKPKKPATIEIKRGDQNWSTSEDKLEALPEKVRGHVEKMLGRAPRFRVMASGEFATPDGRTLKADDIRVEEKMIAKKLSDPKTDPARKALESRLEQMNRNLEQMQKQVEEMRKSLPKE